MGFLKSLYGVFFSALAILGLLYGTACNEYSYEGGLLPDTTIPRDTIAARPDTSVAADTALLLPPCALCKHATSLALKQWQFRADTLFFCGAVTNAVLNPEEDAFTFFGPSACTAGTGLIITAYFSPQAFADDQWSSVTSSRATLQYYNNGRADIFRHGAGTSLTVTVSQFERISGIAIGYFSGTVLTAAGAVVPVTEGHFKVQF